MRKNLYLMLIIVVTGALASCVTSGPQFMEVPDIPEGKALVYIYRPANFVGSAVSYEVKADNISVVTLHNGGYFPYFTDPRLIQFSAKTETESSATLDVIEGQSYYIKGYVSMGVLVGRPILIVVPSKTGRDEITKCKLIIPKD